MAAMNSSKSMFERALQRIPGGVNSPVRAFGAVGGEPILIHRGEGSKLYDIDGNAYIDFMMSWGPLIFGHAHSRVIEAAESALKRGFSFGAATAQEIEFAETLCRAVPSMEQVRLVCSGTEAVMSAIRLARGATGQSGIIKFDGCYHGHSDALLVQAGSGAMTFGVPSSQGVPESYAKLTYSLPYNNIEAFKKLIQKEGKNVACVIVEPIAGNMGLIAGEAAFLQALREETKKAGIILIFDEVITGFRLCWGGAQALFNLKPDLTCLGKIIGGGLPLAAFGGSKELMSQLAPLGPVYQAGTLSGNPIAVATGLKTVKLLESEHPYEALEKKTTTFISNLKKITQVSSTNIQINTIGSMFTLFFAERTVTDYESAKRSDTAVFAKFFKSLLKNGVYITPSQFETNFLSTAHSDSDLDQALSGMERALREAYS